MVRNLSVLAIVLASAIVAGFAGDARPRRVLALVDNSHHPIVAGAQKDLAGRVRIEYPKSAPPGDTGSALARLDELLGDGKWDAIYFNFGLADLHHKDPKTKEVRALAKSAGGVRVSSPETYEKNLRALVDKLEATGARLIWANTLPIPATPNVSLFDTGSEVEYNAIAAKIMNDRKVPIVDLHAHALANPAPKKGPAATPLHPPVVAAIQAALN